MTRIIPDLKGTSDALVDDQTCCSHPGPQALIIRFRSNVQRRDPEGVSDDEHENGEDVEIASTKT